MKLIAKFKELLQDGKGNAFLTLTVDYRFKYLLESLEDKEYSIEIKELKNKRSIQQNRMLWALIHEIDIAYNGKPTDEYDIYIMALERANAKYDYVIGTQDVERSLKENFRAVKFIKKIDINGKDGYMYKVFIGSSKMNTQEMSLLIDAVLDIAQQVGIDTTYYEEVLR